jgi:ribose transport system permease protein
VLLALVAVFGLMTERFLTTLTLRTIANQIPDAALLAIGMTFVIIVAGIDLSVGSVLALSAGVLGVTLVRWDWPLPFALSACLLTGLTCGALNGFLIARWSLPSFIVTLGMLEAARGGAYIVTNSQTVYLGARLDRIGEGAIGGLALPFFLVILIVVFAQFVLTRTVFGRYVVAIGTNEEAVRLSGIDPRPIRFAVFAIAGLMSGLAAVVHSGRLAAADPNAGIGMELQAIAAVVIGGTSLLGGRGSVISTFFGVMIIAVLGAGLAQMGVQEPTKRLITGGVIVGAAIVDYYRHRIARRRQRAALARV